nr:phosphatidylserine decarboxylase proenzyme [Hymenolepis microstoma]
MAENDLFPCNVVWNRPQIDISQVKPPNSDPRSHKFSTPSPTCDPNLGPNVILEDVHTDVCQKTQGGYDYDVGLHWRILAAILYGIYTWFPLNTTSRIVGKLTRVPLPRVLRGPVVRAYAWIFSARLEEAEFHNDLARYNSISQFFRRRLVPSARPVDPVACLTSPADGKVISCGRVEKGHLEQVKGLAYTIRALLGPHACLARHKDYGRMRRVSTLPSRLDALGQEEAAGGTETPTAAEPVKRRHHFIRDSPLTEPVKHLYHCAIYLAPGDYHCFHSPADWKIDMRRHFPGRLFSVCSLVTSWLNGVFCINERAVYMGNWSHGFFAFVAVGATNVGSIHVFSDPNLVTNRLPSYLRYLFTSRRGVKVKGSNNPDSACEQGSMPVIVKMDGYEDLHFGKPIQSTKGELFGEFNFGSTIVLIFEAPPEFHFFVKRSERVRVGQALGNVAKPDS